MKPLHLIDYQGNVRPGRVTIETITEVLEGRESDRLATVAIDDGAIVVTRLDAAALDALRIDLIERRRVALRGALDHALALTRTTEGLPGVRSGSMFSGSISIDLEASPWAEDVALAWAEERHLYLAGTPHPGRACEWTRSAEVRLDDQPYATAVVSLRWPKVRITDDEIVAADADESGRTDDVAKNLRAGTTAVIAAEEPF